MEQMFLELQAKDDTELFQSHPYFLGRKPYPMQAECMRRFYANAKMLLAVWIIGMRAGKTRVAADIACREAFELLTTTNIEKKYNLEAGSKFYIICVATSESQAEDTIFFEIKKSVKRSPFFEKFDPQIYSKEVRFEDYNVEIIAGLSSALALVGRTVKCNVFDELAKLEKTEGKRSAELVYSSLSKSTASFKFAGKNIVITSPLYTEGKDWRLYKENLNNPYALCLNMPTWVFNPNLPFEGEYMQARLMEDPITFWRDFGAQPQATIDKFYKDESILRVYEEVGNVFEDADAYEYWRKRQRTDPVQMVLAADPSGRMDSFGLGVGFKIKEDDVVYYYIIGLKRYRPEIVRDPKSPGLEGKKVSMEVNPLEVRKDIVGENGLGGIVQDLFIKHCVFDTWNYPLLQKELELMGRSVYNNIVKIGHYEAVRKLQYADTLRVCNYPLVLHEWETLRQVNAKKVDHPKGGSKDLSDCVSNIVWLLDELPERRYISPILGVF